MNAECKRQKAKGDQAILARIFAAAGCGLARDGAGVARVVAMRDFRRSQTAATEAGTGAGGSGGVESADLGRRTRQMFSPAGQRTPLISRPAPVASAVGVPTEAGVSIL